MFHWTKRKRVQHPSAPSFYQFYPGPTFTPGADGFVFEPKFGLPPIFATGPGQRVGTLSPLQPPQIWNVVQHPQTGFGVQAGQFISQPLADPEHPFGYGG